MGKFQLSEIAAADFEAIFLFTAERFGTYQAEGYAEGLNRTFALLADFPLMGRETLELKRGIRRFAYQSHVILYRPSDESVVIVAIVHGKRNLHRHILDEL